MEDVLIDARRITDATNLPLLVDIDTGWGSAFNIARTIRSMIKAGAAGGALEIAHVVLHGRGPSTRGAGAGCLGLSEVQA